MSLATILYPELRALPATQRVPLLRRARRSPFDVPELLAMAAALVVGAWLAGAAPVPVVPLAALLVGACFVRRTRRALRSLARMS